jgi:signal transduction histidine kinase
MRRQLSVILLAVVLPATVLAMLGFRTIREERRLVDGQIRETLDRAADRAAGDLERELAAWPQAVAGIATGCSTAGPITLTPRMRAATSLPGNGVVMCVEDEQVRFAPPDALAWDVGVPADKPAPEALPQAYRDAEARETVREDYKSAAHAYRALLRTASGDRRTWLLHRLARTTAKMGLAEEALRLYRELQLAPPTALGAVPSDLLARYAECNLLSTEADPPVYAACGVKLYLDLARRSWHLDKERYLYYTDTARAWATATGGESRELTHASAVDARRRGLTRAVEEVLSRARRPARWTGPESFIVGTRPSDYLCFVAAREATPGSVAAAVVSVRSVTSDALWRSPEVPELVGVALTLSGPDGEPFFGAVPAEATAPAASTSPSTRSVRAGDAVWQIRAAAGGRLPIVEQLERRSRISSFMFGLMVLTLAFGVVVVVTTTRRALEIARMKSQFVSTVSHEFRSPLTAIRQLTELLARGRVPSEERKQEYYDTLLRESDRLSRMVENVLDFSRMEERRKQYRFESFNTGPWLQDAIDAFRQQAASLGKQIDASVPPDPPRIVGDREALTRVVHNLLDNAAKYSPDQPTIWLRAAQEGDALVIIVRDAGVGIPRAEQERVFDRFFRGSTLEASVKGTGLGLAIVKHAVEAHGGRVTFESEAGQGSVFTVRLPCGGPKAA